MGPRSRAMGTGPRTHGPMGPGPRTLTGRPERREFSKPSQPPSQPTPRDQDKPFGITPHWNHLWCNWVFLFEANKFVSASGERRTLNIRATKEFGQKALVLAPLQSGPKLALASEDKFLEMGEGG